MTRDDLELALRREGLTRPQVEAAMCAADAYALTQARAAITAGITGALARQPVAVCGCGAALWPGREHVCGDDPVTAPGWSPPPLRHYLTGGRLACGAANVNVVNTARPARVTCEACRQTDAWKEAAA